MAETDDSLNFCRSDVIAQVSHAKRLAQKLYPLAKMVELHGGHLVSHERTKEVNEALLELIRASESNISPHDWTNLSGKSTSKIGQVEIRIQFSIWIKIIFGMMEWNHKGME
uniref:Uncharacterized protein n=1 Tax=Lactuca sativa TaxID=4236 RepID=A0A9R1WU97_LACSA|nr:hypothetical protein LSAT_V11C900477190 [Lactuca sativa]